MLLDLSSRQQNTDIQVEKIWSKLGSLEERITEFPIIFSQIVKNELEKQKEEILKALSSYERSETLS